MKTSLLLVVVLLSGFMYSCSSGNCTCTRAIWSFAGGQVIFYPPLSPSDTMVSRLDKDSLTAVYGPEKDSTVQVTVLHNSASWTTYQSQGYSCGCAK